jgi:hypothetical protein
MAFVKAVRTGRKTTTTKKTAAMAIKPMGVPGSKSPENDPAATRHPNLRPEWCCVSGRSDRNQGVRVLPPEFASAGTTAPGR